MLELYIEISLTFFVFSVFLFLLYLSYLKSYKKSCFKKSKIAKFDSHDFTIMYSSLILSIILLVFSIIFLIRIMLE